MPVPDIEPRARSAQVLESWAHRLSFIGTVLVARGDTVLLDAALGPADAEGGVPNSPGSRYLLASVSKQFTAAAVLRLVDQGRIGLDDPVRHHLPELPAAWRQITVRHLLAHTSGIPNHNEGEAFEKAKTRAWTPRELLTSFVDRPLEFEPGTRFRYSNSGYVVAGLLIERVSGLTYGAFLERELFAALGLRDTAVADGLQPVPRLARGYRAGSSATPAGQLHLSVPYAAGALYGSTSDLLRWQRALYGGRVLSAAGLREMTRVQQGTYALGLGVRVLPQGRTVYHHSGAIDGFSSYLLYEAESQVTVALLANREGLQLERMAAQLAEVAAGRNVRLPHEVPRVEVAAERLRALEGAYERRGQEGTFWVRISGERLWARQGTETWRELWPVSDTRFHAPDIDAELAFVRDAQGRGVSLSPVEGPGTAPWQRVDKPAPTLDGQALFLRGSANEWSTRDRLVEEGAGRYVIERAWPAGAYSLKFASADWKAVDLGGDERQATLEPGGGRIPLAGQGRNLELRLAAASSCRFVLDGRDVVQPALEWSCRPQASGTR